MFLHLYKWFFSGYYQAQQVSAPYRNVGNTKITIHLAVEN